ncbi:MAG: hypothetical protein WDZ59_01375 [Pirellulales bacterium]
MISRSWMTIAGSFCIASAAAAWLVSTPAVAGDGTDRRSDPDLQKVELFQAMEDGQIEVKFVAKNERQANVLITNKTKQPLSVQLPQAFAGVPTHILAQVGGVGGLGGDIGGNDRGDDNGSQAMGGGMGMMGGMGGMGGGGMGMGGGMFNVAPDRTGKIEVACVCLEHGKPNPRITIDYTIVPAEKFVKRPEVIELLKAFGTGKLNHAAAQAAVWHLNNDRSWQQLALERNRRIVGPDTPFFTPQQLRGGMMLAAAARREVQAQQQRESGKENSLSAQ